MLHCLRRASPMRSAMLMVCPICLNAALVCCLTCQVVGRLPFVPVNLALKPALRLSCFNTSYRGLKTQAPGPGTCGNFSDSVHPVEVHCLVPVDRWAATGNLRTSLFDTCLLPHQDRGERTQSPLGCNRVVVQNNKWKDLAAVQNPGLIQWPHHRRALGARFLRPREPGAMLRPEGICNMLRQRPPSPACVL